MWFLILRYFYFSLSLSVRVFPLPRLSSSTASLTSFKYLYSAGISTCYPSDTPFGLSLGPDLPWADEPSPGNLRLSTAISSTNAFALASSYYGMLLYHLRMSNNMHSIAIITFVLLCQTSSKSPQYTNVLFRRFLFVFLALLASNSNSFSLVMHIIRHSQIRNFGV